MCQRGFMVALNSSRLLVAGTENTQVQQASPSWYYSWGTSTWSVTFQNKSFSWTETKQCDESNFHFSIVKYVCNRQKRPPGEFSIRTFFARSSTALTRTKDKKKKKHIFFKTVFSETAAQQITGTNTTAYTRASLEGKILSVSNLARLLRTDMSAPSYYSIQQDLLRLTITCDWSLVVLQQCLLTLSASAQSFYSLLAVASSAILSPVWTSSPETDIIFLLFWSKILQQQTKYLQVAVISPQISSSYGLMCVCVCVFVANIL